MDATTPADPAWEAGEPDLRQRLLAPTQLWSRPKRLRVFATNAHHARARRASDLFLGVGALVGVGALAEAADPPTNFERALEDLFANIPAALDIVWRIPAHLFFGWALVLPLLVVLQRRFALARDVVVAGALGAAMASVLDNRVLGDLATGTSIWDQIVDLAPPGVPVSVPLTVAAAVVTLCSPHLTQPARTMGRWLAALGTLGFVALEATTPTGAAIAVLAGVAAAATTHLVAGSGGGSPSLDDVRTALDDLAVTTGTLAEAQRQTAGVYQVETTDDRGRPLLVKVYGRDARDTQALARLWRTLWYRDAAAGTVSRLQQAEHEAFATLLAEREGVRVDEVVRAGRSDDGDAVLVLRRTEGPSGATCVDRRVDQMWDEVLALHRAGLVHGDLSPDRFRPGRGGVVIAGLAGARVAATADQRNIDLAQLVVSTALVADVEVAASVAATRLGSEAVAAVLPYLQVAGLGSNLRAELKGSDVDPDQLRVAVATEAGVEEPPMAKLRRVTKGGLARAALLAVAAYFVITSLSGIDFSELVDELEGAAWGFLVVALFVGQTPRFAQAEATRGACPRPLAYGPLVLLQFGISFVNLAIPSTAARVAVNIRFFQRQGIPPASAVSIGVIDSLGGFVIQLTILLSVFVFGAGQVDLDLQRSGDGSNGGLLVALAVAAGLVVIAAIVAACIPKVRRRVADRVRPWLHEVRQTVGSLRSPAKLAQLLGGNLAAEVLFAATLGIVVWAYGESLPLGTLLAINVAVSLFAGLMPVPGGIGVAEGALTVGLTSAGIDQATALAIAMSYRLVTYYLPPVWGAVAFHRLERNGFI